MQAAEFSASRATVQRFCSEETGAVRGARN